MYNYQNSIGMDQHKIISKVIRDLKQFCIIAEDAGGEIRPFLNQIWVAGWERREAESKGGDSKRVAQYNKDDELINTFMSIRKASLHTGFSERNLGYNLQHGRLSRAGYYWRYI